MRAIRPSPRRGSAAAVSGQAGPGGGGGAAEGDPAPSSGPLGTQRSSKLIVVGWRRAAGRGTSGDGGGVRLPAHVSKHCELGHCQAE